MFGRSLGADEEAEPLLLQGYDGLQRRKSFIDEFNRSSLTDAAEGLIRLYEATNQPDKARIWRNKPRSSKRPAQFLESRTLSLAPASV